MHPRQAEMFLEQAITSTGTWLPARQADRQEP
jgi:hypothetical protein